MSTCQRCPEQHGIVHGLCADCVTRATEQDDVRGEFLRAVREHREREWGHTPTGAFDAIEYIARTQKPRGHPQATPYARYLLDVAAACLAAVEAEPSMWKVGKP